MKYTILLFFLLVSSIFVFSQTKANNAKSEEKYIKCTSFPEVKSEFRKYFAENSWIKLFSTNYNNFKSKFTEISYSDISSNTKYFITEYLVEKNKFDPNNLNYYKNYDLNKSFFNSDYDNIFYLIDKMTGAHNLILVKEFNNSSDAKYFFKNISDRIFLKNDSCSIKYNVFNREEGNDSRNIIINSKNSIAFSLMIEDKFVFLSLSDLSSYGQNIDLAMDNPKEDHTNLFNEIDKSNTFRGLKFGSTKKQIQDITAIVPYESGETHTYRPLNDDKFNSWLEFNTSKGGCFFYFSEYNLLSAVSLGLSIGFNNEGQNNLNAIIQNLRLLLGKPIEQDDNLYWIGENIMINIPTKSNRKSYVNLIISSNRFVSYNDPKY